MRVWRTISLLYFGTYTIVILQFLQGIVLTGPVIKRSIRMIREVYPEIESDKQQGNQAEVCIVGDVVYGADEPVPSDQPCLKCKCQPPGVQCEAIQCSQKQGCKAIHKSNQCCPEYQCECVHNGTVYGNGERLATLPGGECSVCYCRGGEVQCANVSCYKRTDCEGRTVPGQCCPKYDHCPLREPTVDRSATRIVPTSASATTDRGSATTAIYDIQELDKEDNKITDNHLTFTEGSVLTQSLAESTDYLVNSPHLLDNNSQLDNDKTIPNITIQEIIPEIKEIPITTAPKPKIIALAPKAHITAADVPLNSSDKQTTSDAMVSDADSESSEISEIYHHPPPVLKIGDKLLIFKKGELVSEKDISTPVPVITIIGAEGLQRGTEDSSEFHEISSQLQGPQKDVVNFDDFFDNETVSANQVPPPKESHIVSFVKQKKFRSTTTTTPEPFTDLPPTLLEFEEVSIEGSNSNTTLNEDADNKTKISSDIAPKSLLTDEVSKDIVGTELVEEKSNESTKTDSGVTGMQEVGVELIEDNLNVENLSSIKEDNTRQTETTQKPVIQMAKSPPTNSSLITDSLITQTETPENTSKSTVYYSAHILINTNATLLPSLLKQVAFSDVEDDSVVDVEGEHPDDTQTLQPFHSSTSLLHQVATNEPNTTDSSKEEENLEDSGEFTTARNNQTSELLSIENASVETTQELNTRDLVEILPGFQLTTENSKSKEEKFEDEAETINVQQLTSTIKPAIDFNHSSDSMSDDEILRQLNKELNNTFSSLNLTAFNSDDGGAEAIFKELLEEVASSTLPPHQEGSFFQLHEKESQLLQKVSEAISKFQAIESKEALDARIMEILKEFFNTQHKSDSNKTIPVPVLPTAVV